MNQINLLSSEQEKRLLQMIIDKYTVKDSGASRLVIFVSTADIIACGISVEPNGLYVVKVAVGLGGINQTNIEANAYRNYGDEFLARIYFLGHYVEIMERVECFEYLRRYAENYRDDFIEEASHYIGIHVDYDEEDEEEGTDYLHRLNQNELISTLHTIYDVIEQLDAINNITNDNGQIGRTADGRMVAYDYGFTVNTNDALTSDLVDWVDFDDWTELNHYLEALITIIDTEEESIQKLEQAIIKNCEQNLIL